jgi:2'-5' RNA ligase
VPWARRRGGSTTVSGIETALVVPVPEAEPVVGSWRRKYASDSAHGMWAHVTLIHPFRESSLLGNEAARAVADVLGGFASFSFRLTAADYFRSPRVVLYLGPEPATPFEDLTRALASAFPDTPPYGGAFEDIVPHLSIADEPDADLLARIEADVRSRLPIEATAREVELVEHAAEGWRLRQTFMLAA